MVGARQHLLRECHVHMWCISPLCASGQSWYIIIHWIYLCAQPPFTLAVFLLCWGRERHKHPLKLPSQPARLVKGKNTAQILAFCAQCMIQKSPVICSVQQENCHSDIFWSSTALAKYCHACSVLPWNCALYSGIMVVFSCCNEQPGVVTVILVGFLAVFGRGFYLSCQLPSAEVLQVKYVGWHSRHIIIWERVLTYRQTYVQEYIQSHQHLDRQVHLHIICRYRCYIISYLRL